MSLFSISYKSVQQALQMARFEIVSPFPVLTRTFLSHLRPKTSPTLGQVPGPRRAGICRTVQVQPDDFHLLRTIKNSAGIQPLHHNPKTAEKNSEDQRRAGDDNR